MKPEIYVGLDFSNTNNINKIQRTKMLDKISKDIFNQLKRGQNFSMSYEAFLKSNSRSSEISKVKHVMYYVLRERYKFKLKEISKYFNRHHAAVIHGVSRTKECLEIRDKSVIYLVNQLKIN